MAETKHAEGRCLDCSKTRNWYAWIDLMPPKPDWLHVIGEVLVPNPGVDPILTVKEPQGINPRILMLDLWLVQRPGIWPQVLTWKQARYDQVVEGKQYDQVQIFCDNEEVALVDVQEVH